ncbi:hypothetical protein [Anaerotruncus rubiinfantis]|uniref:hypothetical protein n=1 Tax=Anaerotruncus rubiinfantis TaxID=1720200 RepID=UPI00189960E9|nr:hypothetical protein [Anaerotruncus rubiinfantis]
MLKEGAPQMDEARLINIISEAGDRYGNLLLKFMERYGLNCLKDATRDQLYAFVEAERLIHYK